MAYLVQIHSIWRWAVLLAAVAAAVACARARGGAGAGALGRLFVIALDVQVLLGLLIWVRGAWWQGTFFRAWVHPAFMILALAAAPMARARERRGSRGLPLYLTSLVLMILGIPWWA